MIKNHISPPAMTTQHVVTEYYEESSVDTYEENEKLAIEKEVRLIFTTTNYGKILWNFR